MCKLNAVLQKLGRHELWFGIVRKRVPVDITLLYGVDELFQLRCVWAFQGIAQGYFGVIGGAIQKVGRNIRLGHVTKSRGSFRLVFGTQGVGRAGSREEKAVVVDGHVPWVGGALGTRTPKHVAIQDVGRVVRESSIVVIGEDKMDFGDGQGVDGGGGCFGDGEGGGGLEERGTQNQPHLCTITVLSAQVLRQNYLSIYHKHVTCKLSTVDR